MEKLTDLPERFVEEGFEIVVARASDLPERYIKQLVKNSLQPHVLKFEGHEDAKGRFKDVASYRKWAEKDRVVYLLLRGDEVGGIIWFGEKNNEHIGAEYNLTFGIRLYEGFVGKGLSKPFMQATHKDAQRFFPEHTLWLDYDEENIVAGKAYASFGYEELARADGRVIMGMKKTDQDAAE